MLLMFLVIVANVVIVVVVVRLLPLLLIMMMISTIPRFVFYLPMRVAGVIPMPLNLLQERNATFIFF